MLAPLLSPLQATAYAMLRFFTGLFFAFHGVQKIFGVLTEHPTPEVGDQLWIGGMIELVFGFAIAIGFLTRLSAFVSSGTMAVAYAQYHWKFGFDETFFPSINGGELAIVYALIFFYIACAGPGRFSLDDQKKHRRDNKL